MTPERPAHAQEQTVTTVFKRPFYERFQAACKDEDRSMSAQLRRLAEQWLDGRGKK